VAGELWDFDDGGAKDDDGMARRMRSGLVRLRAGKLRAVETWVIGD
jgi:hypothetical protein